jgi:hypothetical protein
LTTNIKERIIINGLGAIQKPGTGGQSSTASKIFRLQLTSFVPATLARFQTIANFNFVCLQHGEAF